MKERPIIFSAPMVRAILDGKKTQTRRVIKPQPEKCGDAHLLPLKIDCPFGRPGDLLWVRETFDKRAWDGHFPDYAYRATVGVLGKVGDRWTPSIHMPRWASRITLKITGIRVELVQEISETDCDAEGLVPVEMEMRPHFAKLWNSINAKRGYGWDANPWVWVIEFHRQAKNEYVEGHG